MPLNAVRVLRPEFLTHGCVLYLKFDEGSGTLAKDSSGYNNHGTIYGATWVNGKFGKALSFDGVDDYVEIPHSPNLVLKTLTLEAWVKPKSTQHSWARIISSGLNNICELGINRGGNNKPFGNLKFTDGSNYYVISPDVFEPDVWQHWVFTFDGRYMKLYRNGELVAVTDTGGGKELKSLTSNPRIGWREVDVEFFNGIIDEVRIFNRALTEEEIKAIYKGSRIPILR